MNCNTHGDTAAVAFCRTCGKPLCNQCTRDVRGVIYCESCLAARMEGAPSTPFVPVMPPQPPPTGYQQFMDQGLGIKVPPGPASGPNPAVAGILAGFFPIGVGAVYTGQYAKGLSHLVIMVLLIVGQSADVPWYVHMVLAILMGFFYVSQIIDSARTARAIQMGEPAPDPFGLGQMFGTGERFETTKIPTGAAVLIALILRGDLDAISLCPRRVRECLGAQWRRTDKQYEPAHAYNLIVSRRRRCHDPHHRRAADVLQREVDQVCSRVHRHGVRVR